MILETVDIVATWLQNGTYGVNNLLASVPLLGTDPRPANVAAFLQERTSGSAARAELSQDQTTPVIFVGVHTEADYIVPFDTGIRDTHEVRVSIEYGQRNSASEAANRDGLYTMVAVLQSLYRLFKNGVQSDRTRGTVSVVHATSLHQLKPWSQIGDTTIVNSLIAGFRVRDTSP